MAELIINKGDRYTTDSLFQWDIEQVLEIHGLSLASDPEIHFTTKVLNGAIVRQCENVEGVIKVMIPNSLLQEPFTIVAHVGIYENDTFKVLEKVEIPVFKRERPDDYKIEDTDGEIYSFKKIENELSNIRKLIDSIIK